MKYSILYKDCKKEFYERVAPNAKTGWEAANLWLPDLDEKAQEEGERLNVLLPLIKWSVEIDDLSEELSDELWFYKNDLDSGILDDIIDPLERDEIENDLLEAYEKAFKEEE